MMISESGVRVCLHVVPVALLFISVMKAQTAETTMWDDKGGILQSRGILIAAEGFSKESVLRICKREMQLSRAEVFNLAIITDMRQSYDLARASHVPLGRWVANCRHAAATPTNIALLSRIGSDAVVRIRVGLQTFRLVLAGDDPLRYTIDGSTFDIIHLGLAPQAMFPIFAYATSLTASVRNAEHLYQHLQSRLSERAISVTVRRDSWFSDEGVLAPCWWSSEGPLTVEGTKDALQIRCAQFEDSQPLCTLREE